MIRLSMNKGGAWFESPAPPFSHPTRMLPFTYLFHSCASGLLILVFCCAATAGETPPQQSPSSSQRGEAQARHSSAEEAEDRVRASFDVFTRKWMQKLAATEDFQKKERMHIRQTPDGFVAEYIGYLPHRYTTIKLTRSQATPFVGILRYYKKTMRSIGKTKKQAINGLFTPAETSQVSEIFRYTKGEWVY